MFNNIGGKIKVLAKILCGVGIALSIIAGVIMMVSGNVTVNYNAYNSYSAPAPVNGVVAGLITIVVGSLLSWVGSFFAYGFGQLIENTDRIK